MIAGHLRPPSAPPPRASRGPVPAPLTVAVSLVAVEGAKHLWVGDAERVLDEIVDALNPAAPLPLPTEWEGEMEIADTSGYTYRTGSRLEDDPKG